MWSPLSLLAAGLATATTPAAHRVTALRQIEIHSGLNPVARLAPDGRDGVIVEASPNVEVADQSHTDFMVLVKPAKSADEWAVARVTCFVAPKCDEDAPSDMVSDYPHTGEDQVSSIRFARGLVDGRPSVLLIRAKREFVLPIPSPSPVTIDIFRLTVDPDFGEEFFQRVSRRRYTACFGNSDAALKVLLDLPLPSGFAGSAAAKPCAPPSR